MPVDPGNLMLIGRRERTPGARRAGLRAQPEGERLRLGADAHARRPCRSRRADITGMGVGGLLMEIVTRPQPREEPRQAGKGRTLRRRHARRRPSTRMGGPNKLLAQVGGKPLVRIAAERRWRRGRAGDRRDRPPKREHRGGAVGPAGAIRPQSGFRGGLSTSLRPGSRRCRRISTARWSAGRHAAGRCRADRSPDRGLRSAEGRADRGADLRRQARQSGAVVAALFPRTDDAGPATSAPAI
jgi:hypothetical protein